MVLGEKGKRQQAVQFLPDVNHPTENTTNPGPGKRFKMLAVAICFITWERVGGKGETFSFQ